MTERVVALTTFLPIDQARQALLPPVRLARAGAVVAARTVRHWELALEGEGRSDDDLFQDVERGPAAATGAARTGTATRQTAAADTVVDDVAVEADELPIEDWPELSFADAQARLATCDVEGLRTLLAYEQTHGHRPQYTLLLEQRLTSA